METPSDLERQFLGRSSQIQLLENIFFHSEEDMYGCLFVSGNPGTGKTSVIKAILEKKDSRGQQPIAAFVNCVECFNPTLLFSHTLTQLTQLLNVENGEGEEEEEAQRKQIRCDKVADFVDSLREIADKHKRPLILVFDVADRLRDMSSNVLPCLLRLQELVQRNVCVTLISSLTWTKFYGKNGGLDPLLIHFPDYPKKEMLEILAKDCPADESPAFFRAFVELLYGVFHHSCKNLNELRHMAELLFPKYREPVISGAIKKSETVKLFRHIDPYFKRMLDKLYLREISHSEWNEIQKKTHTEQEVMESIASVSEQDFELPYYTKFLLLAAYISSYNPARLDLRFFTKAGDGKRGSKRVGKGIERKRALEGPKAFPLERMLAIFHNIIEEPIDQTADIHTQVSTLVNQRFLIQISKLDSLDSMKYKCNVGFDFIQRISRSVHFAINNYLYEH